MSVAVKTSTAGLAFLLTAGLTTGCGALEEAAESVRTPADVLAASAPEADTAPFRYTILGLDTDGTTQNLKGVASPTAKSYDMATSYTETDPAFTMNLDFRVVDQASWVRIVFEAGEGVEGLPELPDKWLPVDQAKAGTGDDSLPTAYTAADADPGATGALISTLVDATETAPGAYAGTMDLTGAAAADIIDVAAAGDTVKAVPFTATVDGSGRLTALTVRIPAIGSVAAFSYEVTYAYDAAEPVEAPAAADTAKTPDSLYELLG